MPTFIHCLMIRDSQRSEKNWYTIDIYLGLSRNSVFFGTASPTYDLHPVYSHQIQLSFYTLLILKMLLPLFCLLVLALWFVVASAAATLGLIQYANEAVGEGGVKLEN